MREEIRVKVAEYTDSDLNGLYEYCKAEEISINDEAISRAILRYGQTPAAIALPMLKHAEYGEQNGRGKEAAQSYLNDLEYRFPKAEQFLDYRDGTNRPKNTYKNFRTIFDSDAYYDGFKWNVISGRGELHELYKDTMAVYELQNADLIRSRSHIEETYNLRHRETHDEALEVFLHDRSYNPIKELIEATAWDGVERCRRFLIDICGVPDTKLYEEISQFIFFSAINRLYNPGCKVDEMVVLTGEQGGAKSALVEALAIERRFYRECKSVDPKLGYESIAGGWIIEMVEMDAVSNSRSAEEAKAFISRQSDDQRLPWDKLPSSLPRRCIFIGTSNDPNFNPDPTGGRRYYPVHMSMDGRSLFQRLQEAKPYILQAWAEAAAQYAAGKAYTQLPHDVRQEIKALQEEAMADDFRKGMIEDYVENLPTGSKICSMMIWDRVLCVDGHKDQTKKDGREINQILRRIPCIRECKAKVKLPAPYGKQITFERI